MKKMFENYPNLEIESNKVIENEEEKMKMNLSKCTFKKIKCGPHGRNTFR